MTDREAIKQTIERAYEARRVGDIDKLMSEFHPDAVFELAGNGDHLAVAGKVEGHANVTKSMAEFIGGFDFVKRTITNWIIDGDRVAVRSRVEMIFNPNGRRFTTDLVDLITFKDAKIIELVEFADTAHVKDIMS